MRRAVQIVGVLAATALLLYAGSALVLYRSPGPVAVGPPATSAPGRETSRTSLPTTSSTPETVPVTGTGSGSTDGPVPTTTTSVAPVPTPPTPAPTGTIAADVFRPGGPACRGGPGNHPCRHHGRP